MTTTTVRKGSGRPAANARRNRHAQNTPLPTAEAHDTIAYAKTAELAETHAALRDAAAETADESRAAYGRMTLPELKARASALGVKPIPRTKGALLNAILGAERDAKATGITAAVDPTPELTPATSATLVARKGTPSRPVETDLEPKGAAKAQKFSVEVAPAGWEVAVTAPAPGQVMAVATRGAETLTVVWDAGVFKYDLSGHLIADRTTKIRNVSHGRQLAARTPDVAQAELARVGANKAWRPREAKTTTAKSKLPFDPATVTDDLLIHALLGKHVVWINRISNTEETAMASKESKLWKVTGEGAERVIQFTTDTGFRAARLDMILRVSARPTRKRAVDETAVAA